MNNIDPLGVSVILGDSSRTETSAKQGSSDFDSVLQSLLVPVVQAEPPGGSGEPDDAFSSSAASSDPSEKISGDSSALLKLMRETVFFEGGREEKDTKHYNPSALAKIKALLAAGIGLSGEQTAELKELLLKFGDFFESAELSRADPESGTTGENPGSVISDTAPRFAANNLESASVEENDGVSEEKAEKTVKETSGVEPGGTSTSVADSSDVDAASSEETTVSDVSVKSGSAETARMPAADLSSLRAVDDTVRSERPAVSNGASASSPETSGDFSEALKTNGAASKKEGETAAKTDVNADASRGRSVKNDALKNMIPTETGEDASPDSISGKIRTYAGAEKAPAAFPAASESVKKDVRLPDGVEVKDASASSGEKISRTETAKAVTGAKNSDGAFQDTGKEKVFDTVSRTESSAQNADAGFDRFLKETSSLSKENRHTSGSSYDLKSGADINRLVKTLESSAVKGNAKLTVTLTPENLGRLEIRLAEQGGKITARFFTDNETSHKMMLHQSEAIRSQLADKGIIIDNMEFSFNDAASRQSGGDGKRSYKNGAKRTPREREENTETGRDIANSTAKGVYA